MVELGKEGIGTGESVKKSNSGMSGILTWLTEPPTTRSELQREQNAVLTSLWGGTWNQEGMVEKLLCGCERVRDVSHSDIFWRARQVEKGKSVTEADPFPVVSLKQPEQQVCQLAGSPLRDPEEHTGANFRIVAFDKQMTADILFFGWGGEGGGGVRIY